MSFFKEAVEEDNTSLFLIFTAGAKDKSQLKFLHNHTKKDMTAKIEIDFKELVFIIQ